MLQTVKYSIISFKKLELSHTILINRTIYSSLQDFQLTLLTVLNSEKNNIKESSNITSNWRDGGTRQDIHYA